MDDLFRTDQVLKVEISVDSADWDTIRRQSREIFEVLGEERRLGPIESPYTYVKADVVIDGVEFKGVIRYQGSVQIDGKVDGEIHTEGTLLVGEQAVITAKVNAGSVISRGEIKCDIVAKEKVQLLSSDVMEGSLNTPQLSMENGVVLNGSVEMKSNRKGL